MQKALTRKRNWNGKDVTLIQNNALYGPYYKNNIYLIGFDTRSDVFALYNFDRNWTSKYALVSCSNDKSCICRFVPIEEQISKDDKRPYVYMSQSTMFTLGIFPTMNNPPSISRISNFDYQPSVKSQPPSIANFMTIQTIITDFTIANKNFIEAFNGSSSKMDTKMATEVSHAVKNRLSSLSFNLLKRDAYFEISNYTGIGFIVSIIGSSKGNNSTSDNKGESFQTFFAVSEKTILNIESRIKNKNDLENMILSFPTINTWLTRGLYYDIYMSLFYSCILPIKISINKANKLNGVILTGLDKTSRLGMVSSLASRSGTNILHISSNNLLEASSIKNASSVQTISALLGESIKSTFAMAKQRLPCIIVINDMETIFPNEKNSNNTLSNTNNNSFQINHKLLSLVLQNEMASMGNNIILIGLSNQSEAIDSSLKSPELFEKEISMPMPDASSRYEIIKSNEMSSRINDDDIVSISKDITSGYGYEDIKSLFKEALLSAIERSGSINVNYFEQQGGTINLSTIDNVNLSLQDFISASNRVIPLSLKSYSHSIAKRSDTTWAQVLGSIFLKQEFENMLTRPKMFKNVYDFYGDIASSPRGILMYGPPGNGKTLTASAVANESGYNFISVKSTEIYDKFVGESEKKIRDVFNNAKNASPCIIFFDEIDAIGLSRRSSNDASAGDGVGSRVLITLLTEMDSIEKKADIIVIAATNRPDVLDSALIRPGRFDRMIYVGMPDIYSRVLLIDGILSRSPACKHLSIGNQSLWILDRQLRNLPFNEIVFDQNESYWPIYQAAINTDGCSNADINEMCRMAVQNAISRSIAEMTIPAAADGINRENHKMTGSDLINASIYARRSVSRQDVDRFIAMRNMYNSFS